MIRICDLYSVTRYTVPNPEDIMYNNNLLRNDIDESKKVLKETASAITQFIEYRANYVSAIKCY